MVHNAPGIKSTESRRRAPRMNSLKKPRWWLWCAADSFCVEMQHLKSKESETLGFPSILLVAFVLLWQSHALQDATTEAYRTPDRTDCACKRTFTRMARGSINGTESSKPSNWPQHYRRGAGN